MTDVSVPKLAKWPFFLGDALMAGVAVVVCVYSPRPLGLWPAVVCSASAGFGAWLAIIPFLAEYRGALKLGESTNLLDAVTQVNRIEAVAEQVAGATGQWQGVHEHASKAVEAAREISQKMAVEAGQFRAFIEKANDVEKNRLRLEVEKLRRGEGEWLQILVRLLDNTFALFQAAVRSQQPPLIEQIGQFQRVSRDVARRVGLVAFAPNPTDPFDANLHEVADAKQALPEGAKVEQVIASGYTFQGQLVRKSLVSIASVAPESVASPVAEIAPGEPHGAEVPEPAASPADELAQGAEATGASRADHEGERVDQPEPVDGAEARRRGVSVDSAPESRIEETSNGSPSNDGQPLLL